MIQVQTGLFEVQIVHFEFISDGSSSEGVIQIFKMPDLNSFQMIQVQMGLFEVQIVCFEFISYNSGSEGVI